MNNPITAFARAAIVILLISCSAAFGASGVRLDVPSGVPAAEFAATDLRAALQERQFVLRDGEQGGVNIKLLIDGALAAESYRIRAAGDSITVAGGDPSGLMYGMLELAERVRLGADLEALPDILGKPYLEKRGIKFNIPLDLRTPSYSDCGDAFQENIAEIWSMDFWREFLDELARHRYNVLSLWSLHPFPSMVKVPEFPEVALDDIWRTKVKLDDNFSHSANNMLKPEMLKDVEVVKRITIDEKIRFWREVMQYAHDRGIEVYLMTWNIFTFGAEPKYGINPSPTNQTTIAYFRASVRETLLTYPLLAGIGVTTGENMPRGNYSKEKWLWQTYGEGIRDAKKIQPNRQVRLIHRFHMTGQSDILNEWKEYPDTFDFSFKYAIAHMYSITNPPFIAPALRGLAEGKRTWLTVRNDDVYSFRWGDPTYARDFIRCMPGSDKVVGFYMGPDGYCWGRSFLENPAPEQRPLVIKKQWYSFMLWGRLGYDPAIPNSHFEAVLGRRFPEVPAQDLSQAWSEASIIFPLTTRFFWGDIDLRWLPEACLSSPRHKGFYTVRHFVEGETMPGSGVMNVIDWREKLLANATMSETTPVEIADALERHADSALRLAGDLRGGKPRDPELIATLGDIEAFAHIGKYYAEKIRGACELALFDATSDSERQRSAIRHLEKSVSHWADYAKSYTSQYKQPVLYNRVGWVDIPALLEKVRQDVSIARNWKPHGIKAGTRNHPDVPFRQ